jgi:hypothetical protein
MFDLKFYGQLEAFATAVAKWQRDTMGNDCTYCHGYNLDDQCPKCGFWGLVDPNDPEAKNDNNRPRLEDFIYQKRGE